MTKQTPATTPAPDERDGDGTKLAKIGDPAKITKADIKEIAGEHSDPTDPEQSANADAAETLKKLKADAKKDEPAPAYFQGQGGAAGL